MVFDPQTRKVTITDDGLLKEGKLSIVITGVPADNAKMSASVTININLQASIQITPDFLSKCT